MSLPDRKLPNNSPLLTSLEERYLSDAFRSGWLSSRGPYVAAFEKGLRDYFGRRHACVVSSGTAALHLALKALGVGPGDEVIVPGLTYIAVANAVIYCGAVPVPTDVHPDYWCIDPDSVAEAVGKKTKAIVAVHGFGHPADMDEILAIGGSRGIPVIEDVSQAFGSRYKGRLAGSLGRIGVHSFFANKVITTGEGGAVVTDDAELHARVALLMNHCESPDRKFFHPSVGFNYRMTNLQAAIGCAQLERIEEILERRKLILSWYREGLDGQPGIVMNPARNWASPVNWQVCIRFEGCDSSGRDAFRGRMAESGVDIRPAFVPLHAQPALAGLSRNHQGAVARRISESMLMFPSGGELSRTDVAAVCAEIREWLR